MGQILSRVFRFIVGNGKKQKDSDLEEGLTQAECPLTSSSSSATSSCTQHDYDQENPLDEIVIVEVVKEQLTSVQVIKQADDDGGGGDGDDDDDDDNDYEHDFAGERAAVKEDEIEIEIEEVVVESSNNGVEFQVSDDASIKEETICIRWMKHYNNGQKILLVGEGDFSFSSALATAFISATNIIATSLDSLEFLWMNYRNAISNITNLQKRGSTVMHQVDATEMANHKLLKDLKFDRIIYNFPLAGFFRDEPRQSQLRRNQMLLAKFMDNAMKLLHKNGEIHITHKCNYGFFRNWNLERLGLDSGLRLLEEIPFKYYEYPGYSTKCGFGGDNFFNCIPSKTYKFVLNY